MIKLTEKYINGKDVSIISGTTNTGKTSELLKIAKDFGNPIMIITDDIPQEFQEACGFYEHIFGGGYDLSHIKICSYEILPKVLDKIENRNLKKIYVIVDNVSQLGEVVRSVEEAIEACETFENTYPKFDIVACSFSELKEN